VLMPLNSTVLNQHSLLNASKFPTKEMSLLSPIEQAGGCGGGGVRRGGGDDCVLVQGG
jgi:hypothetical protein